MILQIRVSGYMYVHVCVLCYIHVHVVIVCVCLFHEYTKFLHRSHAYTHDITSKIFHGWLKYTSLIVFLEGMNCKPNTRERGERRHVDCIPPEHIVAHTHSGGV